QFLFKLPYPVPNKGFRDRMKPERILAVLLTEDVLGCNTENLNLKGSLFLSKTFIFDNLSYLQHK
ncbi:MAG: hypothetical protein ACXQS7_03425, partial [Candidatus Syntropharchaeia archaeon]